MDDMMIAQNLVYGYSTRFLVHPMCALQRSLNYCLYVLNHFIHLHT